MIGERNIRFYFLIFSLGYFLTIPLFGQDFSQPGFIDQNQDGRNDWFVDTNGDGVNDVDGKPYPHHFKFEDNDGDGINDLWVDADGDGVNDLLASIQQKESKWIDRDGDGIQDAVQPLRGKALKAQVLDTNGDGHNDITGEKYSGSDLKGYRYGVISEETGNQNSRFEDLDGDGINDHVNQGRGNSKMDQFIDLDGDGIADDRGFGQLRGKGKAKGKQ